MGKEAAAYIMENGLCLEEFHEQLAEAIDKFLANGGKASIVAPFQWTSMESTY